MKTKTIKTPLLMAETYGPTSCSSGHASESKLSRSSEAQYSFVPKLIHLRGKTSLSLKNRLLPSSFIIHGEIAFPMFFSVAERNVVFPHEKFDVRQDMVSCWQADGVSLLTARCQTKTGQRHAVPKLLGGVFMVFVNNHNRNIN